jgi:hypothetical protein
MIRLGHETMAHFYPKDQWKTVMISKVRHLLPILFAGQKKYGTFLPKGSMENSNDIKSEASFAHIIRWPKKKCKTGLCMLLINTIL